jgi:single-strand DNA-binding protein
MSFEINQVQVSGRLGTDPELRQAGQNQLCNFRLANEERWFNKQLNDWESRTNWFTIEIWGGVGQWVANNIRKGDSIAVSGNLRHEEWDAQDGSGKRSAVKIVARSIFPGRPSQQNGGAPAQQQQAAQGFQPRSDVPSDMGPPAQQQQPAYGAPAQQPQPQPQPQPQQGGFVPAPQPPVQGADDDIPF